MIETNTTWEDSGYDCDHCGGQIFKRTDTETGQVPQVCLQCRRCGCQWALNGEALRSGTMPNCVSAQRVRQNERSEPTWDEVWSRRIVIGLLVLALLLVVRFGGVLALRFLLPILFGGFIVWSLVRWYQQQRNR